MGKLQRAFLSGLLTLLPIWLVWIVFKFVFVLLSDISRPAVGPLLGGLAAREPQLFGWLAGPWVQTAIALVATVAFILAVDHFLDMGRSATNVVGNAVASAVVAKWEGNLDPEEPADIEPPHAPSHLARTGPIDDHF